MPAGTSSPSRLNSDVLQKTALMSHFQMIFFIFGAMFRRMFWWNAYLEGSSLSVLALLRSADSERPVVSKTARFPLIVMRTRLKDPLLILHAKVISYNAAAQGIVSKWPTVHTCDLYLLWSILCVPLCVF